VIKKVVETYIKKTKNKDFSFDDEITSSIFFSFLTTKFFSFLRGLKFINFSNRGKYIFFGKNVKIFNKKNIIFGNNVNIGNYVKFSALGKQPLKVGNNVTVGSFSQIIISTSFNNVGQHITIEDNVGMGEFCYIGGGGGTTIGANTIIGQYFSTHPENHIFSDKNKLIREQGVTRQGIVVGKNCWIGSKVSILDGVTVGDNSVIAAGAVVTKSFPNNSVIGGVPAKLIKSI